jgi:hypothetical protein
VSESCGVFCATAIATIVPKAGSLVEVVEDTISPFSIVPWPQNVAEPSVYTPKDCSEQSSQADAARTPVTEDSEEAARAPAVGRLHMVGGEWTGNLISCIQIINHVLKETQRVPRAKPEAKAGFLFPCERKKKGGGGAGGPYENFA